MATETVNIFVICGGFFLIAVGLLQHIFPGLQVIVEIAHKKNTYFM